MKKIIVVSDNHGFEDKLEAIYNRYKNEADLFIHCGDSGLRINDNIMKKFVAVKGNCDIDNFSSVEIIEIENHRILIVHGHIHRVKYNLQNLYYTAEENNISIVLYGHTHVPHYEYIGNIHFFNPGSVFASRMGNGKTFGIITINGKLVQFDIYDAETFQKKKIYTQAVY